MKSWLLLDHLDPLPRFQVLLLVLSRQVFTDNRRAGFICCVYMSGRSRSFYLELVLEVKFIVDRGAVFSHLNSNTLSARTIEKGESHSP